MKRMKCEVIQAYRCGNEEILASWLQCALVIQSMGGAVLLIDQHSVFRTREGAEALRRSGLDLERLLVCAMDPDGPLREIDNVDEVANLLKDEEGLSTIFVLTLHSCKTKPPSNPWVNRCRFFH